MLHNNSGEETRALRCRTGQDVIFRPKAFPLRIRAGTGPESGQALCSKLSWIRALFHGIDFAYSYLLTTCKPHVAQLQLRHVTCTRDAER